MDDIMKGIHDHKRAIENQIDSHNEFLKGNMTAGNVHAYNPKKEVKKKIDKMFDSEKDSPEYGLKKSGKDYGKPIADMKKRRDPEGIEKSIINAANLIKSKNK